MPSGFLSKLGLLSTLAVPIVGISLKVYLIEQPLPSSRTSTIQTQTTLSPSCASSPSLHLVNPKNHQAWTDAFSIRLSRREIGSASDEELLSRFMKGFFGGWTFAAENNILMFLHAFGRQLVPVSFSNIETHGLMILSPSALSGSSLPPVHSLLFGGNFLVLDISLKLSDDSNVNDSHIDIAFGDDQKGFAGFHRFEVTRETDKVNHDEGGGATIIYSSIACNPLVKKWPAPAFTYAFHKFYALTLFRDGIAGVLQG